MNIVTATPTELTLKLTQRNVWLMLGLALLAAGLFVIIWVKPQPLTPPEADILAMLHQHSQDPQLEPDFQTPSTGGVSLELAGYTVGVLFSGGRWLFWLGVIGLLAGMVMVLSPANRSQTVLFNATTGQVRLSRPGWFFRSHVETYPFKNIAEVRVERDAGPGENRYRVCLVISHSEGAPLGPNYVYYKTVIPFSRYRHDYSTCQQLVDRIEATLNLPQSMPKD